MHHLASLSHYQTLVRLLLLIDYEAARRAAFAQTTDAILWLVSSEC